jgi:hypothetical protein
LRRNGLPPLAFYTIKQRAKEGLFCERKKIAEICIFNKKQNGIRLKQFEATELSTRHRRVPCDKAR